MVLGKKHIPRSMGQDRGCRNRPTQRGHWFMIKDQEYIMKKGQSLQQMLLGKLDSQILKNETGLLSCTTHKN